jgi:hypothetical protein
MQDEKSSCGVIFLLSGNRIMKGSLKALPVLHSLSLKKEVYRVTMLLLSPHHTMLVLNHHSLGNRNPNGGIK